MRTSPIPEVLTGFHPNLSEAAYRRDPSLNFSTLMTFVTGRAKPDSEALSFGRLFHSLALTPNERLGEVVDMRSYRKAQAMAEAFHAHPDVSALFPRCFAEASLFWEDKQTAVACKARLDLLGEGIVADLKSTQSLGTFLQDCRAYNYYRQLAWYQRAAAAAMDAGPFDTVLLIAVEKSSPHNVGIFEVPRVELLVAHGNNMVDLERYRDAMIGGAK